MSERTELMVDIRDERPELLKMELGLLGILIVVALFLTHAMIHNYLKATAPVATIKIPYLVPAGKFMAALPSPATITVGKQSTRLFGSDQWVTDEQLFVQSRDVGDTVDWVIPDQAPGKKRVEIYLTKATDYGVVQIWIDEKKLGPPIDLYDPMVRPNPGVLLGEVELKNSSVKLRVQVVGKNQTSGPPFYQFGIQGIAFTPVQ